MDEELETHAILSDIGKWAIELVGGVVSKISTISQSDEHEQAAGPDE